MKRVIIIGSIIIFMILLSTTGLNYIKSTSETMVEFTNDCIEEILLSDYDSAKTTLNEAILFWERAEKLLMLYIKHDELGYISRELLHIKENLMLENYQQVYLLLSDLQFAIKHIYETEIPSLGNVF